MLLSRTMGQLPQLRPAIAVARQDTMVGHLGNTDRSELPYIYHHLSKGCILDVRSGQGAERQHLLFNVSYGGLHLGVLGRTLADRILQLEAEGRTYRLTIASIAREKYLPPTAVQVELAW